ncbi:hypothetical protein D8674_000911 [Pyrus ussuriensis x Pyrus communis]|uniref:ATP-dependent DNA helicase n=1 Tax=Pyrus ussuriensis x Pyrus communis TaxID=2448454 RepID=A0A5N5F7G1_9ROSA|nr:hypothetical protein D8674_000911 [Pyrus ussuriensis x Pyrus communis]
MCDDISKNMLNAFGLQDISKYQDELKNSLLYELEKLFIASNSSLSKHHLPQPNNLMMDRLKNRSLREELSYDSNSLKREHLFLISQLNKEQKHVYDCVMETIDNNKSGLFFVHGHGGTGKTFLWTTIIARIRSQNQIVLAVASSGIASLLLPGGRTAHSRFKIPINITNCSVCEIKRGTHLAKLITEAALIVWDEAPMNHKQCFETLDRSLRDVLKGSKPGFDHLPFGGKPILFGGDFRQILPIVPSGNIADIVQASLTSSYLWSYLTIFFLKQNMRLSKAGLDEGEKKELADFAKWILDIGNGTVIESISSTDEATSWVEIPKQFLIHFDEDPIKAMVSAVTSSKIVPHTAILELNRKFVIVPVNKTSQDIPMQWFNFINFEQLHNKIDRDVELTDVFRSLTAVQPTEEITIQRTRIAKKRNLNLQNISGETVRVTLWGETATTFDDNEIQTLLPPVFIALTSLKETLFSEALEQLFMCSIQTFHNSLNINTTDMYADRPTGGGVESKTINDLLLLDPALHRNESFTCKATVVGSCPSCHKTVKKTFESFECNEHEDRYDDPFILPPILKTLVGKTKQFQLSFGNQNTDFGKTNFIVNGLLQDQHLSNPTIASIKPQTPTTTAGKQVVSQTTPAPLTPSQLLQQQLQPIEPTKPQIDKKHRNEQTNTTNFATNAGQFHNLVVPKIETTDKVPIAVLNTKSQAKKSKESVEDVRSQKK